MKKTVKGCIAVLSLTALTSLANAATPGVYAGLGLGWSKQETSRNATLAPNKDIFGDNTSYSQDKDKLGGRIFAGYNFNQNFGIEAGLAQYANSKYKASNYLASQSATPGYMSTSNSLEYTMKAFDVVGKGYLPVGEGFNVYALGGLALVRSSVKSSADGTIDFAGITKANTSYSHTQTKIRPIYGIGASYDIPQTKLTTNLEFTRIQGTGNVKTSPSAMPSADLLTLNVSYNFG